LKLIYTFSKCIPDRKFLELVFPLNTGYKLNLDNPKTYNEKLQWLKLYDRNPEYIKMVDKVEAKKYAARIIGEEHIIPTLAVYDRTEDIIFDELPNQFVLKCTHDSGGIVICQDKSKLNIEEAKRKLNKGLKNNYFYQNREWPYKHVKPRIIAEAYMEDESEFELKDYKFFCFNGVPIFLKVDFGRYIDHHANYYDMDWNLLPFDELPYDRVEDKNILKPIDFNNMINIAQELSKDIPFVRIDLYNVKGKIFFGELTFFPASGMAKYNPIEWDYKFGSYINLPRRSN
jgi:hypothetical protein